ncbi:hypothetical protein AMTR_s00151p00045430 [Amborella trichopoda]|uniref:Uncharacterized protein n=1 Tax=Amborella trichopoda TaxID=13333 RepID=W1NJT9_AMBTC|nr:hypothetical protein AMTR_s00151p00045430 [Amborella trichopoda]
MVVSAVPSCARKAWLGARRAPDSPPTAPSSVLIATSRPMDSWPAPLDPGHGSRSPAPRVEVSTTSAANTRVASPVCLATFVMPAPKATRKESSDWHASRRPVGNPPLELRATTKALVPPGSKNPTLDVPPLDRAQELARLGSERDSLSAAIASLSKELKVVKAEIEELQARDYLIDLDVVLQDRAECPTIGQVMALLLMVFALRVLVYLHAQFLSFRSVGRYHLMP